MPAAWHRQPLPSQSNHQGGSILWTRVDDRSIQDGFSALPAGTVLDRYRIDSVIAAGGFGITYLCRHVTLGKTYALKEHFPRQFAYRDGTTMDVLPTDPGTFNWALDRFILEGQALARCHHPNVVTVADVFEANQTAYMVLGYEEGHSFKAWLDMHGRAPTQGEIDAILVPLLDALAYVHAQGLLHRDIAPDNIMIRSDGKPCLIDFGSARQAVAERSQMMSSLVKSGYSPPEQYTQSGRSQGPWSDIYATGALLYRAVTGRTPPEATERAFDDGLVPLREAITDPGAYRSGFLNGIEKALVFHYAKRPQTITEWRDVLFAEEQAGAPPASSPTLPSVPSPADPVTAAGSSAPASRPISRKVLAAAAALLLISIGGGIAMWQQQSARERVEVLKVMETERIAREKESQRKATEERAERERAERERAEKAATAAAQKKADDDARSTREKAERQKAEAERAAALMLKLEEDRIARERAAQRKAAQEYAERERAERERAQNAAAAAQRKAEDDARIAREKAERDKAESERAAALKLKTEEDARVARERKAAEERAVKEQAERVRAEEAATAAARRKAEEDARIARETAERDKAEAERAAALKVEEDQHDAREQEAQRKAAGEHAKRERTERERVQKAAAVAAQQKASTEARKAQDAQKAKKQAQTNCPTSALAASGALWNSRRNSEWRRSNRPSSMWANNAMRGGGWWWLLGRFRPNLPMAVSVAACLPVQPADWSKTIAGAGQG